MRSWNELSMAEKADIMKLAIEGGVYDLDSIRSGYNEYANGGSIHIKPENRGKFTALKERTGHSATWFKEHGTPAQKKMATFALNSRHWKHGDGGNLFDGTSEDSQQMNRANIFRRPSGEYFYQASPDSEEVAVTPLNTVFENPALWTYTDTNGKVYSPRQMPSSTQDTITKKEDEGPLVEAAKNYLGELQYDINNGVPIGGKYTLPAIAAAAALPVVGEAAAPILANPYVDAGLTSAFAGHGLHHWANEGIDGLGDAAMTALEVAPLGRLAKPMFNEAALAIENYRYPLGRPQVHESFLTIKPQVRTRVGDVEIDNPGLYYHQADAGKAKNFVSTGRMRTPLEEYWLAKEEAGEHIPMKLRAGIEPGYPQDPGSAMFAQGNLWYGLTPKKPDLLVTAREMPIANKNASIMSDKASLRSLENQGSRRVTSDNIYTQGPHNRQNTAAYTWEPGYGYRRVFAEETPAAEWAMDRTAIRYDLPSNDAIIESSISANPNIPFDEAWLAASKGRHQMSNLVGSDEYAGRVRQAYQDNGIPVNQADFEILQAKQGIEDSNLNVVPNLKNANGDALNGQYDPNTKQILVSQDRDNILDVVESSGHEHAHASEVDRLLGLLKEKWKHIKPRKESFTRSDGSIDTEWKDYISKIIEMRAPAMSVWSEMKELGFSKVGDYLHHLKRFGLEDKQWEALVDRYGLTNAKYMVETVFGLSPFIIGISNEKEDNTTM